MKLRIAATILGLSAVAAVVRANEIVIDFERADIGKPVPTWTEKGVVFALAGPLTKSKASGRITFFPHLATNRRGILNAMATDQGVPVQATFPVSVSTVTLVVWGSTGCPALLEALDGQGQVVDVESVAAVPGRKSAADPVPFLELTVEAPSIAAIRFSGPRDGEFLAADEIRFTPAAKSSAD
jgi:hypothetical protein